MYASIATRSHISLAVNYIRGSRFRVRVANGQGSVGYARSELRVHVRILAHKDKLGIAKFGRKEREGKLKWKMGEQWKEGDGQRKYDIRIEREECVMEKSR